MRGYFEEYFKSKVCIQEKKWNAKSEVAEIKIVLLEPLPEAEKAFEEFAVELEEQGHTLVTYDSRVEEEDLLIERAEGAQVIILTNIPLPARVIEACGQLKMISVGFTGYDHIDIEACRKQGITVCNAPDYATQSVAELAVGMMISVMRRLVDCDCAVRQGKTSEGLVGNTLGNKTLGIVGTGSIGLRVARLGQAFGCQLLGYNRSEKEKARQMGLEYVGLETLLQESDIVSIHLPLTAETEGLIGSEEIGMMKSGAVLINTARGPIVDSEALAEALADSSIAGAGIDVFETEPPIPDDHPLLGAANTVLAPHVGYAAQESFAHRARTVCENVLQWMEGSPQNVIVGDSGTA